MSEKYKILVVDDEKRVRSRIISQVLMHETFEVTHEASNGLDALDIIENHPIDVVFSDIRMPYSDGIDLTRQIRRTHPKIKVAFISGYDDFQYAKEAIDLEVVTFLQKPVTAEDINKALKQLSKSLAQDQELFYNEKRLESTYKETLPLLIENQFNALLQEDEITEGTLNKFKLFDIDLNHGEFVLLFIEFNASLSFKELQNTRVFIINLVDKLLNKYNQFYHFNTINSMGILINHNILEKRGLEDTLNEIIFRTKEFTEDAITIGVSNIFKSFYDFPNAAHEAKEALSYEKYLNTSDLLFYSDVSEETPKGMFISDEEFQNIEYTLKFDSDEAVNKIFNKLTQFAKKQTDSFIDPKYYVVQLSGLIMKISVANGIEINRLIGEDFLNKVFSFNDLESLLAYIKNVAFEIRNYQQNKTKNLSSELSEKIIAYVDTHYQDSKINMDKVCQEFHISSSYMGVLFKKGTGIPFNKYIIQKRVEKAQELLLTTNMKIIEIAENVGYQEVYHFSHSFKKVVGKSPKEYRNAQLS